MAVDRQQLERIDAHHHLWRFRTEEFDWISDEMSVLRRDFLVDELSAELGAAGVAGCVAVQARSDIKETRWLLECAERCSSIRGVVGWVPLVDAKVAGALREFRGDGLLKGVRHIVQAEPDGFLLGEAFGRGVEAVGDAGLVYDLLVVERQWTEAVEFVRRHRGVPIVLDHLGKPAVQAGAASGSFAVWREMILRLGEFGNVSCKLSGLVTEADWARWTLEDLRPYLDVALEAFGAERLMAGSDWPVCLVASGYGRWWSTLEEWAAGLGLEQQEAILGGTARRVYRLS